MDDTIRKKGQYLTSIRLVSSFLKPETFRLFPLDRDLILLGKFHSFMKVTQWESPNIFFEEHYFLDTKKGDSLC